MKIVIAENQTLFRHLLVKICEQEFNFSVLGAVGDAPSALELCRIHNPDILLFDIMLPDGIEILQQIHTANPEIRILVLSSHPDPYTVHRVLEHGVYGFLCKQEEPFEVFKEAIHTVKEGQKFFSASILKVKKMLKEDPLAFPKILSQREQQMLTLFAAGLPNQLISQQLGISPKTVQGHRHNIMKKLEIHDTPALMRYAIQQGFWKPQINTFDISKEEQLS